MIELKKVGDSRIVSLSKHVHYILLECVRYRAMEIKVVNPQDYLVFLIYFPAQCYLTSCILAIPFSTLRPYSPLRHTCKMVYSTIRCTCKMVKFSSVYSTVRHTCKMVKFSRTLFIMYFSGRCFSLWMKLIIYSHIGDRFILYTYRPFSYRGNSV